LSVLNTLGDPNGRIRIIQNAVTVFPDRSEKKMMSHQ